MSMLRYKGYDGSMEVDLERGVVTGKILSIDDLVTYETSELAAVEREFKAAVEDYLDTCASLGREPRKPYGGVFNVRTTPEKHRTLSLRARERHTTLNGVVNEAIDAYLEKETLGVAAIKTASTASFVGGFVMGKGEFTTPVGPLALWDASSQGAVVLSSPEV